MKTFASFLLFFLLSVFFVTAQVIVNPPLKPDMPFLKGENLIYQVRYGFIVGGTATFTLTEELYHKKLIFHAKAVGQSTGIANTIYGVKDIYESWFDKETTLPYKQVRNIKEGRYTHYNEVTYNRKNSTVLSKLTGVHKVPAKLLDLCSLFYYIRRIDFSKLTEGDVVFVQMFFADEVFPSLLRYLGKETIRTKSGKMSCYKVCPVVEVGRMFKTENDLTIWFSDDEKSLPVLVKIDIRVVGAVLLKLLKQEYASDLMVIQP